MGRPPAVFSIRTESCTIPRMQAIPWSTIALGSLLLISAYSKGGQEVQSSQPEKSKPPVKMEQRGPGRVIGIGGVFFKSANRDQMREWYSKHLGLVDKGQGAMLPWREHDDPQKEHVTVWTVFPASTDYFDPSHAPFMVNYIVDDLDAWGLNGSVIRASFQALQLQHALADPDHPYRLRRSEVNGAGVWFQCGNDVVQRGPCSLLVHLRCPTPMSDRVEHASAERLERDNNDELRCCFPAASQRSFCPPLLLRCTSGVEAPRLT